MWRIIKTRIYFAQQIVTNKMHENIQSVSFCSTQESRVHRANRMSTVNVDAKKSTLWLRHLRCAQHETNTTQSTIFHYIFNIFILGTIHFIHLVELLMFSFSLFYGCAIVRLYMCVIGAFYCTCCTVQRWKYESWQNKLNLIKEEKNLVRFEAVSWKQKSMNNSSV